MHLDEMLLCKDETRRQWPPPADLLAAGADTKIWPGKSLFPGNLHAADKSLVPMEEAALGHISHRVQDLQEGGGHWCSSGDAAHHHQEQDAFPRCSGLRTQTESLLQSPRPLCWHKKLLTSSSSSWEVYPHTPLVTSSF